MESRTEADLVIKSNAIFTGLSDKVISGGVAVKADRIIAVGTDAEIKNYIGPMTEVLTYTDELIMPGFNDAHFHLSDSSLLSDESYCISLFDCSSEDECVRRVEAFASEHPDNPWIYGVGWNHWMWPEHKLPSKNTLNKINTDRPICLQSFDMHSAWVNNIALELAGISLSAGDSEIKGIERLENGEVSGLLFEPEAVMLVTTPALSISDERLKTVIEKFLKRANQFGITTIADVFPRGVAKQNAYNIFQSLDDENRLNTRIMFFSELKNDLDESWELKKCFTSEKLKFCGLKQLADGVVETHTAYMVQPYSDQPANNGGLVIEEDVLRAQIVDADKNGFSVRVHAIGDGAVRLCLDIFEEVKKVNGSKDLRHSIEHIENIQDSDIPRFKALGVTASMMPCHAVLSSDSFAEIVGEDRVKRAWALKSIIKTGAKYAFGTDSPIADMNPFHNIYAAVERKQSNDTTEKVFNLKERISVADVLKGYTSGSAYVENMDSELGTLEEGKLADLIVLSKNLLEVSHKEIPSTEVKLTVMNGEVVYRKL